MSQGTKLFLTIVIVVIGLLGLGMTLCGGVYTVFSIIGMLQGKGGENYSVAILIFSVPALLMGGVILWQVRKRWRELSTHVSDVP